MSVISANFRDTEETVIPNELKYVEVIAVTASSGYDANTESNKSEENELASTVTLLVTEEQSKILAELEEDGNIHLSLVYRGDEKEKFLNAQDEYLENFKNGDIVEFEEVVLEEQLETED